MLRSVLIGSAVGVPLAVALAIAATPRIWVAA
jgi:hypothetical protein